MSKSKKSFAVIIVVLSLLLGCVAISGNDTQPPARGMFSWKEDVFLDRGVQLFSFMKENGFTELYQSFSNEISDSTVSEFLANAKKEKIDVFVLAGDPSWGQDSKGKEVCGFVERAAKLQKSSNDAIKGIVLDVEPHTTSQWKKDPKHTMETYISAMKAAYNKAVEEKLEVTVCIPYYYDDRTLVSGLKSLIRTGCDRVAIMNYFKTKEVEHIENEMRYAQRYGKKAINIFEFNPVGEHGVSERNTYNTDGFNAALTSYGLILEAYPEADLMFAAHDYEALKEVLK